MSAPLQKPKFPFTNESGTTPPAESKAAGRTGFREEQTWEFLVIAFPIILALLGVTVTLFPPIDDTIRFGWLAIFILVAIAALMAAHGQREVYKWNIRRRDAVKSLRP